MNHLKIKHFKCFDDADIYLNKLTIMAGANGTGKSSAIQALLYLRRTIEHCGDWVDGKYTLITSNGLNVPLNGVYCLSLGNSSYVINQNFVGNTLSLGLFNETEEITVDYEADDREAKLWLTPTKVHRTQQTNFPIFKQQFYYLNSERMGPRISQKLQFADFPNAGWQGENTAQLISLENGYYKIENSRRFYETETSFLQDQINHWLDYIIKGAKIKVESNPKTLSAQILVQNHFTAFDPTISTNVGFGISYVLPILATGLIAEMDSIFIVENPEAHLHPSAQSKIGRFLAMVASSGVNVIIETHSDHVLNGIQISVVDGTINNESVSINYFNTNENNIQPDVQHISTNSKGELSGWPNGFFDQTQIDYAELFKLRKG